MANVLTVTATNNAEIDGLLGGTKWTGTITYSFPTSPNSYVAGYGLGEPDDPGFAPVSAPLQFAVQYAISLISSYTNANIVYAGSGSSDIMVAQSPVANPTSWAYLPDPTYSEGGDAWFGTDYDFSLASLGNYYFMDALHEIGHSFGLKHSNTLDGVANVAVPTAHDDSEYTVMSYRSYVGAADTGFLTNEDYGYAQTYMANDILALQTLYGANYTTHSENTVYSWSPTTGQQFINGVAQLAPGGGVGGSANRIFETIWDGNGIDTYDLSNYTTGVTINLNPGASSITSTDQLAYLGDGHYASGNIYNAYLFNNDPRSYIDNAIGGSGNDIIIGNAIANVLNGGAGNDTLTGGGGNDTIIGGTGIDVAVFSGARANYLITYNVATQTFTVADQRAGSPDGTDTITGVENFQFSDGTFASLSSPATIESFGVTSLVQVGNGLYLNNISTGSGPALKYGGTAFEVQQFGWAAIGAEQTAGGYKVAWKIPGADQYTVWNVDSNGNFVSNTMGVVSGTSNAFESIETSFNQDLNGDGVIGLPSNPGTVLESFGSTSLIQLGQNLYLGSTATGPALKYGGSTFVVNQFGWAVLGAEQTASGYQVAWKMPGKDQYTVWNVDSSGNFVSNTMGVVSGTSRELEAIETSFHQDLNGDGVIGVNPTVLESFGSTSLTQLGQNLYFDSSAAGPTLKYGGADFVVNQFGWAVLGAEQTASGYQVAWKMPGKDQYTVWNVDSNGNFVSNTMGVVSGTSRALEAIETSFHQDLNGDGVIGVNPTVLESFGSTSLTQLGQNLYFDSSAAGPTLKYGGADFVLNQFGWAVLGAEQTASGYQVAWKMPGKDQYTVWNVDSNGNFVSNTMGVVSGTSRALEAIETSFHQDLNGDGVIGVNPTVLESFGSTSLTQLGQNLYFDSSAAGPTLKYGGADFVVNQFGWAVLGAEQTAGGYQVAWKMPGKDQYTVWNVDSSGNFVSNTMGVVSGTSRALEAIETSFHQDLNGDGVIGVNPTVLESFGSTSLTQLGQNLYFDSSAAGPALKYGGATFVVNQFGWAVLGAEQTASGYQVAWKMPGADQYTVWNVDSSGNFVSNTMGVVSGTSRALEAIETSFHQDLNGDGVIGVNPAVIESFGSTSLTQLGQNLYFDSSAAGPALKYGGATFVVNQFGWAVLGAEQTASGYLVAWKMPGADQYTVWNVDSSGNFVSNTMGVVSGTSRALEAIETSFHQDLNGDGVIGVTAGATGSNTLGSTSQATPVAVASNDTFALKLDGAAVATGQLGSAVAAGAGVSAIGFHEAWNGADADAHAVWNTASGGLFPGNATGAVSDRNTAFESFKTSFHQDLNGSGIVEVVAHHNDFHLL